jgi:Cu-Zn family superoxide dismutase
MKYVWLFLVLLLACSNKTIPIYDREGGLIGSASFSESSQGVVISVSARGVSPGVHGVHIHEKGVCRGDFSSAGAHYNPENREHGMRNPKGHHAGDMPNIRADDNGVVKSFVAVPLKISELVGHSIVIHEGADDQLTDPAGNSGDRIACGVIQ